MSIIHDVAAKAAKDLHAYASDYDCTLMNLKSLKACVAEVLREVNYELSSYEVRYIQYVIQQGIKDVAVMIMRNPATVPPDS